MDVSWMVKYVAEFLGTMFLVLLGNGTVAAATLKKSNNKGMGSVGVAIGFGIGIMVPVLAFANVSGAHINPAVTLALAVTGKFPWGQVAPYIIAQLLGAIVGQLLVVAIFNQYYLATDDGKINFGSFATTNALDDGTSKTTVKMLINGFTNEFIGMFVFMFGILAFTTNFFGAQSVAWCTNAAKFQGIDITSSNGINQIWATVSGASASKMVGALGIGLMFMGIATCFGGATGFAMNPARDLGPRIVYQVLPAAVVGKKTDARWVYSWVPVVATILGAMLAAAVFKLMFG